MENKPNIKIAFFDIDWTLYDHKYKRFNRSGIRAIKKLKRKGVKIYFCTLIPYHSIKQLGAFKKVKVDGYISSNGAVVNCEGNYLRKLLIADKDIVKTIEVANKYNLTIEMVGPKKAFRVGKVSQDMKDLFSHYYEKTPKQKNYEMTDEVVSMTLFCKKNLDKLVFPSLNLTPFRYCDSGVELNSIPHLKGEGIDYVLRYYDIPKENALAAGDDIADIDIFNKVKYSIAMGNGKKEVKEKAYLIAKPIEQNGLALALMDL